ncbi:LOW QUALITY PROTEIN: uncharacterized protein RCH25_052861 [Pelodytes ibericus]
MVENVNTWVSHYIKKHGGPYEIPQDCRHSWESMQTFLGGILDDKKTSKNKIKGCVMQGLMSCCIRLQEIVKEKIDVISERGLELKESVIVHKELSEIVDLRMHEVTTGEALIDKAKLCDVLTEENDRLKEKVSIIQRELEECRHATNVAFDKLVCNTAPPCLSPSTETPAKPGVGDEGYKPIYPWEDIKLSQGTLPAAPTTTTTVLNASNTGEMQVTTKKLKHHEMDAIVKEIGHVPQHDIKIFAMVFVTFRVSNMYSLTVEDVERVLQRVIGNGLWARIKQTCGEHRRTKVVLKELLWALYGIAYNVSLSGKIKQLKQESPYELSSRIAVIMALLVPTNPGFVEGDIVHRFMFMDALEESLREEILCVTPDPRDLNDILLRADNWWRKKERWFAVDSARVFRVEGQQRKEVFNPNSYSTGNKNQQMGQNSQVHRGRDRHDNGERRSRPGIPFNEIRSKRDILQAGNWRQNSKPWIPFSQLKSEHENLQIEYDKIRAERDLFKEQLDKLKEELSNLKVDVKVAEVEAERGHLLGALDFS